MPCGNALTGPVQDYDADHDANVTLLRNTLGGAEFDKG
jgi:hypothetical protein